MKIAILVVTKKGVALSKTIRDALPERSDCILYTYEKYYNGDGQSFQSLFKLTAELFHQMDALVFVSACGIAVRSVAACLHDKTTDPAVLVVDEGGHFVISLLSGHIGGANRLSQVIADKIGAVPVITTATDTGRLFSPDSFAVANGLYICEMDVAKEVAAALLNGEAVGLYSEYPCEHIPPVLQVYEKSDLLQDSFTPQPLTGICISGKIKQNPFKKTLHLVPKNLVLGVGCKRQVSFAHFEQTVLRILEEYELPLERICKVATIDIKREEPALVQFCETYRLPFVTFSADELMAIEGNFHHSAFVEKTTGADNVCERSAVAAADGGQLVVERQAGEGVTVALAAGEVCLDFEREVCMEAERLPGR